MAFFGGLGNLIGDVLTLPVAVARDVVTLGGALTDEECATVRRVERIMEDLEEASDGDIFDEDD